MCCWSIEVISSFSHILNPRETNFNPQRYTQIHNTVFFEHHQSFCSAIDEHFVKFWRKILIYLCQTNSFSSLYFCSIFFLKWRNMKPNPRLLSVHRKYFNETAYKRMICLQNTTHVKRSSSMWIYNDMEKIGLRLYLLVHSVSNPQWLSLKRVTYVKKKALKVNLSEVIHNFFSLSCILGISNIFTRYHHSTHAPDAILWKRWEEKWFE